MFDFQFLAERNQVTVKFFINIILLNILIHSQLLSERQQISK